jgi:hypothetical protein
LGVVPHHQRVTRGDAKIDYRRSRARVRAPNSLHLPSPRYVPAREWLSHSRPRSVRCLLLLGNADRVDRKPQCARNRTSGRNVKWPAIRAWGEYHSRVLDRWAANTGRSEGAKAEKAVPFPCAARRSFVLRLVAFVWFPAHAQLDGESASCSPGHRAMCWSLVGARAAAAPVSLRKIPSTQLR